MRFPAVVILKPFWVDDVDKNLRLFLIFENFQNVFMSLCYAQYAYMRMASLTNNILGSCSADFWIKSEQSENSTNISVSAGRASAHFEKI